MPNFAATARRDVSGRNDTRPKNHTSSQRKAVRRRQRIELEDQRIKEWMRLTRVGIVALAASA